MLQERKSGSCERMFYEERTVTRLNCHDSERSGYPGVS